MATVELESVIDRALVRGLPARVVLLGLLVLTLDGFDIQAVAFAAPALVRDWQIGRAALTPVLAAGLVGLAAGALLLGRIGDLVGRRPTLVGSTLLFATASLLCARSHGLAELAAWRFVTGIGLGAPIPLATAMIAEFTPRRWRSMAVTIGVIGVPLGGMLGSALAQYLVPHYGWPSIFVAGAVVPAALALVLYAALPESPKFLARRDPADPRLRGLLRQLAPAVDWGATRITFTEPAPGSGLGALLTTTLRRTTLSLWVAYLSNLLVTFVFFNWLPTVLGAVGLPVAAAIRGALAFNLGGVAGALLAAALVLRLGSRPVAIVIGAGSIATTYLIGLHPVFAAGPAALSWSLYGVMALAGICLNGMQVLLYGVAAQAYPTAVRASGLGSCGAVGRVGGLASTAAGGVMLQAGFSGSAFFGVLAATLLPTLAAVVALRAHVPPALGPRRDLSA